MILRPVSPQSPCGPPITKRPVGFTRYFVFLSHSFGRTGFTIVSMTASIASFFIRVPSDIDRKSVV